MANSEWFFMGCSVLTLLKNFGASGDAPFKPCQPASAGFVFIDTDFSRWTNRESKAPAEPKTAANSEWRMANGFFWRAALLRCRKNFVVQEHDHPGKIFKRRMNSALRKNSSSTTG